MTGPPMSISMDFIASGLVELIVGSHAPWCSSPTPVGADPHGRRVAGDSLAAARERDLARPNTAEVRAAQRDADYAYRLAVDAAPRKSCASSASRPGRSIVSWPPHAPARAEYEATRLREQPLLLSVLLVVGANIVLFWSLANATANGTLSLGQWLCLRRAPWARR